MEYIDAATSVAELNSTVDIDSWNQPRTSVQLASFVMDRFVAHDDIDEDILALAA